MTSVQFNNTIAERDMDLLFAESVLTDPGFCRLLVDKTDLKGKPFQVSKVELSKSDSALGESDITVILEMKGRKYGFLVEDKIDAIAMPEQHARYVKRGEKGVKDGEYDDFRVFLFCPVKYYEKNKEAKLYEHLLTYEDCLEHFAAKSDPLSVFRREQLEQAISKAKSPYNPNVDEKANTFLRQYIRYQKEHYPSLDLSTKEDKNGWWTDFRTELGNTFINHKIREGFVDLTLQRAADKIDRAKITADWARHHKIPVTDVLKTKNSVMMRIRVPQLDIEKGFDAVDKDELNQCFDAVKELTNLANIAKMMYAITE